MKYSFCARLATLPSLAPPTLDLGRERGLASPPANGNTASVRYSRCFRPCFNRFSLLGGFSSIGLPPSYAASAGCICPVGDVFSTNAIDGKLTRCLATAIGRPGELSVGDVARAFSKAAERSKRRDIRGSRRTRQRTAKGPDARAEPYLKSRRPNRALSARAGRVAIRLLIICFPRG